VGGEAEWLIVPESEPALRLALELCRRHGVPWRVLGGGSNILVDDAGVPGVVLMPRGGGFERVTVAGRRVVAGGAVRLGRLLEEVARRGLSGLEPLAGIPGTLAGAVVGNAGGRYGDIGPLVTAVVGYTPEGERRRLERPHLRFDYRRSNLDGLVVTAVELELEPATKEEISRRMADIIDERRRSQPLAQRSAGCVFRNPAGRSAGALIDRAGLKGRRIGAARISPVHANFIVNLGGARSEDVLALARLARREVLRRFGVALEFEVKVWSGKGQL